MAGLPYISRKGRPYYLRRTFTKKGRPRYVFSRKPSRNAIRKVPPGYRIVESVNGVVSLARVGPSPIAPEEVQAVRAALRRHPRLARYALEARGKALIVFEPIGGLDECGELRFARKVQYTPVFRFTLVDPVKREYLAERMCYRSWVDGWLSLNDVGTLRELSRRYLPHLGRESFYELF
jgi:hypothetical protein